MEEVKQMAMDWEMRRWTPELGERKGEGRMLEMGSSETGKRTSELRLRESEMWKRRRGERVVKKEESNEKEG